MTAPVGEAKETIALGKEIANLRQISLSEIPEAPKAIRAPVAHGLGALSGFLYFLGFPGVNLWPLALIAQAPLLLALRGQSPRRAAAIGFTSGMVISLTGFYWLLGMLRTFSGLPWVVCLVVTALLSAYQAGRTALLGFLYARAERRGWPRALVFVCAFVATELCYPLLFPWYFGASVHNAPRLLQAAEIGGPYLLAIVLIGPSLAIAERAGAWLEERRASGWVMGIGLALPALAAFLGGKRLEQIDALAATAPSVRVGIVQGNQPLVGRHRATRVHLSRTQELKERGAELVIWSEGAIPITFAETNYQEQIPARITKDLGVPTVVGAALWRRREGDRRRTYFNTALLVDREGTILGRYDKHFLLLFGEYLPFGKTLPFLYKLSPNSGRFSPGESLDPMLLDGHRLGMLICYEDILPAFVNKLVRHGDPDLLVNLTNDAWFGDTTEPWEHMALAQLRAVEHRRYLIRATNSGVSAIIDAAGRVVLKSETFREEALLGEARYMRQRTLYEMLGDGPWYGLSALSLVMALLRWPGRKKAQGRTR